MANIIEEKILNTSFITATFLFILVLISKYLGGNFVNPDFLNLLSSNIILRNFMMFLFIFFSFDFTGSHDENTGKKDFSSKIVYSIILFVFFIMLMRTPPYFICFVLILLYIIYVLDSEESEEKNVNKKERYADIQVYIYVVSLFIIAIGNFIHMKNYKKMLGGDFSYFKFYFDKHISESDFERILKEKEAQKKQTKSNSKLKYK